MYVASNHTQVEKSENKCQNYTFKQRCVAHENMILALGAKAAAGCACVLVQYDVIFSSAIRHCLTE